MPKKSPKFVLSRRNSTVVFNLDLVLLPVKVDLILKKRGRKRDALNVCSINHIKIVLVLSTKAIALHVRATMV